MIAELAGRRDPAQSGDGSGGSSAASHAVKASGRSAEAVLYELAHFATPAVRCRAFANRARHVQTPAALCACDRLLEELCHGSSQTAIAPCLISPGIL